VCINSNLFFSFSLFATDTVRGFCIGQPGFAPLHFASSHVMDGLCSFHEAMRGYISIGINDFQGFLFLFFHTRDNFTTRSTGFGFRVLDPVAFLAFGAFFEFSTTLPFFKILRSRVSGTFERQSS
jgi:hypothetical protein